MAFGRGREQTLGNAKTLRVLSRASGGVRRIANLVRRSGGRYEFVLAARFASGKL